MSFPMNVAVASAVRTPVGRAIKGTLKDTRPDDLAGLVLREAVRRVPGLAPEAVEDVVLGCAMPEAEQGLNMARNAVFLAPNFGLASKSRRTLSQHVAGLRTGLAGPATSQGLSSSYPSKVNPGTKTQDVPLKGRSAKHGQSPWPSYSPGDLPCTAWPSIYMEYSALET